MCHIPRGRLTQGRSPLAINDQREVLTAKNVSDAQNKACSLHVPFQMTELLQHWQLSVRGRCLNISFPANPYSKRQREMSGILNFRVRFPLFVQRCLSLVMQRNDDRNAVRFFASRRLLTRPIASTPSSFQNTGTEQALQYFLQPRQLVHCEAIGFPIWL